MKKIKDKVDFIFYNAKAISADSDDNIYEAIAVRDNKIFAVGNNDEILALKDEMTKTIDCKEKTLMPGINDSHSHLWQYGVISSGLIIFGISSIKELLIEIENKLVDMQAGEWLTAGSFIESQFEENRVPTKDELDKISPNNPVYLERIFGACVVNSKALELAGITSDSKNPERGEIVKDEKTGEPTGVLLGNAIILARSKVPGIYGNDDFGSGSGNVSNEDYEKSIKTAMEIYLSYGITSVNEPGVSPQIIETYQNLRKENELKLRVSLMPNWHGFNMIQESDKLNRLVEEMGFYTGFGDEWLRFGALKMAIDGGLTSKTAYLSWAYKGEDKAREPRPRFDITQIDKWVKNAHDKGFSVGIHIMGDEAIEIALNAIYKAHIANPQKRYHQLIHCYYPRDEHFAKIKEAGIFISAQNTFIYGEADGYGDLLDKDKQESFMPLKTFLDKGITVATSSDAPSAHVNPYWGLYSAVTRKGMRGFKLGDKEKLTVLEAVKMMTINGAFMSAEDEIKGSLEIGKLADILVLDRDLLSIDEEEIKDTSAKILMIDGKLVYNKLD